MRTSGRKPKIVVVGAGIAGSLIVAGLRDRDDCEVICLERVGPAGHGEAGTGLNIGPNAIKCLRLHLPQEAERIVAHSLPWSTWSISLTSGRTLMELPLDKVADNPGIRIRWAELYALLRAPSGDRIRYHAEVTACGRDESGTFVTWVDRESGLSSRIDDIDLLIAGDGRYSLIRAFVLGGPETPRFLNVCLYRLLFPAGADCPIDDYGQWFNGPNRLLAFRVPGDMVYCAGSFPIPRKRDAGGHEAAGLPAPGLSAGGRSPFRGRRLSDRCRSALLRPDPLGEAAGRRCDLQPGAGHPAGGDAAHPMVPTLGQGATQACEDACVAVDEIKAALAAGRALGDVPGRVEARQVGRARFVVDLSRQATDTMLAGADPVEGTRWKAEPDFHRQLMRLYRDVPLPREGAGTTPMPLPQGRPQPAWTETP